MKTVTSAGMTKNIQNPLVKSYRPKRRKYYTYKAAVVQLKDGRILTENVKGYTDPDSGNVYGKVNGVVVHKIRGHNVFQERKAEA